MAHYHSISHEFFSAYLEEVRKKPGVADGDIWFMQRELKEKQKYLPKSKQQQL